MRNSERVRGARGKDKRNLRPESRRVKVKHLDPEGRKALRSKLENPVPATKSLERNF